MIAAAVMAAVFALVLGTVAAAGLVAVRRKLADDAAHALNRAHWADLDLEH